MRCADCDVKLPVDEPQTCYYTGRGPCGDCRDPKTNEPLDCFIPLYCNDCQEADDE